MIAEYWENGFEFEQNRIGIEITSEFERKRNDANDVISYCAAALGDILIGKGIITGLTPDDPKYVVKMTAEVKKMINSGEFVLDHRKTGECLAQLRNVDTGKLAQKLDIAQELAMASIDPMSLAMAIQMKGIERKLARICETLDEISSKVSLVMQGQVNDRIGLFYSGFNMYKESELISDPSFKMLVSAQSLKTLTDSCEQMNQSIQSDIAYLLNGQYKKKKNQTADIDWRIKNINNSFEVIHNSFGLRAAIYFRNDEYDAMMETVRQYGRFLSNVIVPNAGLLTEFDKNDRSLVDTKWDQRANALEQLDFNQLDFKKDSKMFVEG